MHAHSPDPWARFPDVHGWFRRLLIKSLCFLTVIVLILAVVVYKVYAGANTIPQRETNYCIRLGWQPGCTTDGTLQFERKFTATLIYGVDEKTHIKRASAFIVLKNAKLPSLGHELDVSPGEEALLQLVDPNDIFQYGEDDASADALRTMFGVSPNTFPVFLYVDKWRMYDGFTTDTEEQMGTVIRARVRVGFGIPNPNPPPPD